MAVGDPVDPVKPPSKSSNNKGMTAPRSLGVNETFQDMTAWEVSVKNFYRKDEVFYPFVNSKMRWDSQKDNYNLNDEHEDSTLKREAQELSEDLVSFLQIMAGFIPGDHLRVKIVTDTTSFADVIKIIREFLDAEIGVESELDFMKISRKPQEPHRMFYERMCAHVREHLVVPNKTVGSTSSGEKGDTMTLSMQNMVVKIFLHKIDPKLSDIIKKEYGPVLKTGKLLCELIPEICRNIDNLLEKERLSTVNNIVDGAGAINKVDSEFPDLSGLSLEDMDEHEVEAVNTIKKMYSNKKRGNFNKRFSRRNQSSGGREQSYGGRDREGCYHCEWAKKAHNLDLNSNHPAHKCPNRKAVARLVQVDEEEDTNDEGEPRHSENYLIQSIQSEARERRVPVLPDEYEYSPVIRFISQNNQLSQNLKLAELRSDFKSLTGRILRVVKPRVRKEKSPTIEAIVRGKKFIITVDEGAELNIISADLVRRANIPISITREGANAADGGGLKVIGQTQDQLIIFGYFQGTRVEINLGYTLVVENLAADVLMGEPGKKDNKLWTKAHTDKVYIKRGETVYSTSYFKPGGGKQNYSPVKLTRSETVAPDDFLKIKIPEEMKHSREVLVTPRRGDTQWFKPMLRRVINGEVVLKNITNTNVMIRRGRVFGEIRACREAETNEIKPKPEPEDRRTKRDTKLLWDINRVRKVISKSEEEDDFQYLDFADREDKNDRISHLGEIQIDPDKQLSQEWRDKFRDLMQDYDEIVDPAPGKYNGKFGKITTKINFAAVPPPSDKVYIPNYSKEMMEQLATKMDALIRWGVLVRAESVGVTVEHISPCMLVPKGDGDGFRLVTDFSRLNTFIGKYPSVSPTIQDAKDAIARKRYATHLDLSNYFYQGGVSKKDAQYLGVVHPYQGLFIYVCEPQGLKNCSEHAYERLAVIFGDLVRQERMTRHADGLHVLGDTVEELYENLALVLERCRLAGLTLKPSKVIIAPLNSVLFGWRLEGNRWLPTEHTTSALATCEKPSTVKKMRSFIGAFKQFSDLVPGYAKLLHPLELVAAGKESRDSIEWTAELEEVFKNAQKATTRLEAVTVPRPDDKLHTYSDYSADGRAVGGKMIIERKTESGTEFLLAGHYSVVLDKFKAKWLPCEGEAAGIKLTLTHFKPWIIDNQGVTTHHTDNQPSVQAWKRLKKGAYSTSSRISSFLSELSQLSVELEYTPGREMKTSDFASRNAPPCSSPENCQICKFAAELQTVGDKSSLIRRVTVEDVQSGRSILPLSQKPAWKDVQHKDTVHSKLLHLINIGQSPNSHKTKGDHTKLKQLHSLFIRGDLVVDKDNTVMVKTKNGAYGGYAISIPYGMFPGLVHTLHIRLNHPSKTQLSQLIQRYFYTPGHQRIVNEVSDSCFQCCSLKPLPGVLIRDSTTRVESCGTNFSADVMEREGQKVLLVRESLTCFTWARLIPDQKADTMETALLSMILPFISEAGATVRTDGATAFQSLAAREDTDLRKHNIILEVGRLHNENKNPQAENCIKEFEKETLRFNQDLRLLNEVQIANILKTMNTRIRHQGKSSQEMLLKREMMENRNINIEDKALAEQQQANRQQQSKYQEKFQAKNKKKTTDQGLKIGDFVFIRKQLDKHKARELHVIHDEKTIGNDKFLVVRKSNNQLRGKTYLMLQDELIKAPIKNYLQNDAEHAELRDVAPAQDRPPRREAARKAREKFGRVLHVVDGEILFTPVDHFYGAPSVQASPQVHRRPCSGNISDLERFSTNVSPFHVDNYLMMPARDNTFKKMRHVNPYLQNPYGEDVVVDLGPDDDHDYQPKRDNTQDRPVELELLESSNEEDNMNLFSLSQLDNSNLHSTLSNVPVNQAAANQAVQHEPGEERRDHPGDINRSDKLEEHFKESDKSEENLQESDKSEENFKEIENAEETNIATTNEEDVFFEANSEASQPHLSVETLAAKGTIPLTARGDLTRELDLLLERGITPPQPPPRRASGPSPALPPRKSDRTHSFKGNYKDLHLGRVSRPFK